MRICIYHNLQPGGAKNVILSLAKELTKLKDIVTLLSPDKLPPKRHNLKHYKTRANFNFSTVKHIKKLLFCEYKKDQRQLAKSIDSKKYDIVIVGGDWFTQTPILLKYLKTPSISITHELKREFYEKTAASLPERLKQAIWKLITLKLKRLEIEGLKNTNKIVTNSVFTSKSLERTGFNLSKIETVYPPINRVFLSNTKKVKKQRFYLAVGNVTHLKGHELTLKVIAALPQKFRFPLLIIGRSAKFSKKLFHQAEKLNLETKHKEKVSQKKLISLYKRAKLAFYFAIKEPFGLVPVETLMSGTKLMAINNGGFAEIAGQSQLCHLVPKKPSVIKKEVLKYINETAEYSDKEFKQIVKKTLSPSKYAKKIKKIITNSLK